FLNRPSAVPGVWTKPGRTALTRMLRWASSSAAPFTSPSTPDFDVLYVARNGHGIRAASDEMHTIEPLPPAVLSGVAERMTKKADTMFLRRSSASSSPVNIKSGFIVPPPTTETAIDQRSASAAVVA